MKFTSIRAKTLVTILPLLLLVMVMLSWISYYYSGQIIEDDINQKMSLQMTGTLNDFQAKLNLTKAMGESLARFAEESGSSITKAQYTAFLKNVLPSNDMAFGTGIWFEPYAYKPDVKYFGPYVYKDNGALVYTEDYEKPSYDFPTQDWYKIGKNITQPVAWSEPFYDDGTKVTMFTGAFPFYDANKRFMGIASIDTDMKALQKAVTEIRVGQQGYAFLVDKNGNYLADKDAGKIMKKKITEDANGSLAAVGKDMLANAQGTNSFSNGNDRYRMVYEQMPETGWILALVIPEAELYAPLRGLLWRQVVVTIIAILLLFFVIVINTREITESFRRAIGHLDKMAEGDFATKITKDRLERKDETGQLARAFDKTQLNIRVLLQQVMNSVELLAASSEQMTSSAEQSAQASSQVAASIAQMANGTAEQMAASHGTSDVIEKMSTNIRQMATTANGASSQSVQAADKATEGNKAIEKAVTQMAAIDKSSQIVFTAISKLSNQSKEIGQIVDTIAGIAGQTNLLALNAAIEAARAGEQGRGFAVVADEVRKLAEQSEEAAKQIAKLIGEIQGDTGKAVEAMQSGNREVRLGAEVVASAGQSFREITAIINQVSEQMKDVSVAIEQMATGSQQIVGSVKLIDNLSKTAAGEAETVSAATEEQSAAMEEIASASRTLATLASELQSAVNKFNI